MREFSYKLNNLFIDVKVPVNHIKIFKSKFLDAKLNRERRVYEINKTIDNINKLISFKQTTMQREKFMHDTVNFFNKYIIENNITLNHLLEHKASYLRDFNKVVKSTIIEKGINR